GVRIEHDRGLIAHSDGDVVLQALCDALLGALALGDIGRHFPDTDPQYKGADSGLLLKCVYNLVREQAFVAQNVDITILAQRPRMAPYIDRMRENIAQSMNLEAACVSIKATT